MASAACINRREDQGLELQLTGDVCARISPAVLEACVNAAVACVEKNHLDQEAFSFTGQCVNFIAEQILRTDCVSQGFGFQPSGVTVRATKADEPSFSIHFSRELSARIDERVLEACANNLVRCADANHPVEERFSLNDRCLAALSEHDAEIQCVSQAFGLLSRGPKQSA